MAKGVLMLLGSGETAPGMTKIHRQQLARLGEVQAVNLDTAYGFQENVPQMTAKLVDYFATSLQTTVTPLHFVSYEDSTALERATFKHRVRTSNFVFAGPGSPSYALRQWQPLNLTEDLSHVLANGGTVCFASAAALTLGAFTAPIYEIYKVGVKPYWLEGLDLMKILGLECIVVPHFDNNEGGNYDTRCCYLGLRRLSILEGELPATVATLGIDEHTAVIIDLETDTLRVLGRSHAYWRINGMSRTLQNGTTTPLQELQTHLPHLNEIETTEEELSPDRVSVLAHTVISGGPNALTALAELVDRARQAIGPAIDAVTLIEEVLAIRSQARKLNQYELADQLRNALAMAGVEVNDGSDASTWALTNKN